MIHTITIMVKDCSLSLDKNVSANPETGFVFSDIFFSFNINSRKTKNPSVSEVACQVTKFNKLFKKRL